MDNARKYCLGSRVAPREPIPLRTMLFLDTWDAGVQNGQCQKLLLVIKGGAPNTHTSVHHGPENLFVDT